MKKYRNIMLNQSENNIFGISGGKRTCQDEQR